MHKIKRKETGADKKMRKDVMKGEGEERSGAGRGSGKC